MDERVLVVKLSEIKWSDSKDVSLITYSLGSCVGLTLWDPVIKVGGLAHVFLPHSRENPKIPKGDYSDMKSLLLMRDGTEAGKYADLAVPYLVFRLIEMGAKRERLEAKMAGGAHLMRDILWAPSLDIGALNQKALEESLKSLGIELKAKDVGGDWGRTMELSLRDGKVRISSVRHGTKEI